MKHLYIVTGLLLLHSLRDRHWCQLRLLR